jgi:transcriptional regulator with XRE-family HTH domain
VVEHLIFFKALGQKARRMRLRKGFTIEDMGYFGFSTRHWQQIEKGRPLAGRTILRICDAFRTSMPSFLRGLDKGAYKHEEISPYLLEKLAKRAVQKRKQVVSAKRLV